LLPAPELDAELGVAVAVWMILAVLQPEQGEGDMVATAGQLSPYLQPVRLGALGDLGRTWIELCFQGRAVQLARQGPAQADRQTPIQAGPDRALRHIQAEPDLAQAPLFGVQPEPLAYTTHRQSPLGHLVLPSAKWVTSRGG